MSNEKRLLDNCEYFLERAVTDAKLAHEVAEANLFTWRDDRERSERLLHGKDSQDIEAGKD